MKEKRYDVLIKDHTYGVIISIPGRNMTEQRAEKRFRNAMSRVNLESYMVVVVPHKKGRRVRGTL